MSASREDSMPIKPEDEGLHAPGPQPEWNESAFLAWRDSASGVGGNHRIGNEINRGTANMWLGLYTDSGMRFRDVREGVPFERMTGGSGLKCDSQQIFHDGKDLRLVSTSDDYSVNLVIKDLPGCERWATSASFTAYWEALQNVQKEHYNSHCAVSGTVRIRGSEFTVSGYGWRDHSWGPRKWEEILNVRIVAGNFGGKTPFGFYSALHANGALARAAMINRDGQWEDIKDFELTVAVDEDGVTAKSADVRSVLPEGAPFDVHFDLADGVLVKTRDYTSFEAVGDVTALKTGQKGFGYFALTNNPRAGREQPPLFFHGVAENGFSMRKPVVHGS